ncbi:MAG: DUF2135 domain-containing protein [Bacteroidia bacterium]|nr:DUF2135 domain-containing protein [Bacteroidia bacterium]
MNKLVIYLLIKEYFMNKAFCLILSVLLLTQCINAQVTKDDVTASGFSETLLFVKDNSPVNIQDLGIDVKVIGNIAVTTFEITFANPNNRVLEGELNFPLGEGQTVTRFAMDINGVLREAVPVEKEKGQYVFEDVIRQKVDPGLLEKTKGNNYKARVYPIPANGTKRILISYEQELKPVNGGYLYLLPLGFNKPIGKFLVNIEVLKQSIAPVIEKNELENFSFQKWNDSYKASVIKENFIASGPIAFTVPGESGSLITFAESGMKSINQKYFYASIKPEIIKRDKKLPIDICLFWDASSSNKYIKYDRIFEVLDGYFKKIGNTKIKFVTFSNEIQSEKEFQVIAGNWDELKSVITKLNYDGGTQLGCLNLKKYNSEEFILISDGISTFGDKEIKTSTVPVIVINENQSADHSYLKFIASSTGGVYLNLLKYNTEQALSAMLNQPFQFISATFNSNEIEEVYPSILTPVNDDFSISGLIKSTTATVTLNFGFGNEIVKSVPVTLNINNTQPSSGIAERMWAVKKINELDILYDKNKAAISEVGKKYSIVTRNTSLIILDNLEDYIKYKIEPPTDLLKDYIATIDRSKEEIIEKQKKQIEIVVNGFNQKKEWWNREYNPATIANTAWITQKGDNIGVTGGVITGTLYSAMDNNPISNATIEIGNTGNGIVTDNEGKFSLVLPAGSNTITCKANEYVSQIVKVNSNILYIWLKEKSIAQTQKNVRFTAPVVADTMYIEDAESSEIVQNEERLQFFSVQENITETNGISGNGNGNSNANMNTSNILRKNKSDVKSSIKMAAWNPQTPYLTKIKAALPDNMYNVYIVLKNEYGNAPSFYIDVADYFFEKGRNKEGLRILSNLAELEMQNHQTLRVLAHRLEQLKKYNLAISVFEEILKIRREEPQSFRDLGLVYAQDGQYQRAIDTLYNVVITEWNTRFPEVGVIVANEINAIINEAANKNILLNTDKIDKRLLAEMPVDIRVVLNWDSDNCDIDLWVTDPRNEKCYYSYNLTRTGGTISKDFTGGYGPEEFQIKNALNGKYLVQANYYGTRTQTITGPTTIQLEVYTHYMNKTQKKETVTLRLTQNKEVIKIADVLFDRNIK